MNAVYLGCQEEILLLKEKLDTQKLESENKIKEYETRIELIKDKSEIEIEKIASLREDMKKTRVRDMLYRELIA